ncbi:B30.2/SPRY domain-containing protein [Haematococcus lacustris]|uniref:B30.2/SPRY domain-containing protein n=1 Tax=Haematococcus lacustris TaxID=44745 RepID=A0A699ZW61_HAELA|nr:B30.2/SPRY domain-containing protein [Haematococcus lacustris]
MNKFVDRTSSRFIRSTASGVVFMRGLERPTTVTTQQPVTAAGVHAFEVVMPVKDAKTAVGFMADPPTTSYMTPTYSSMPNYISMGGAGFVWYAFQ